MFDTAITNINVPIQVWINLTTGELALGVFAPVGPFQYEGDLWEYLSDL